MKKIIKWFLHFVSCTIDGKTKVKVFDCSCGKNYEVCLNKYGQGNTGCGSCDCGEERTYIN